MVATVAEAGVQSSMMLTLRHDPVVRAWLAGLPAQPPGTDTVASATWLSGAVLGGPNAASPWRAEQGALLDIGPHVVDLLDAALGAVDAVPWAHLAEPDLWRFGMEHAGGAQSTVTISLRLPVDPSEIEFAVFGGAGTRRLAGHRPDALACFARLLDEFVAGCSGAGQAPALDAARGLRLQQIIQQVRDLATCGAAVSR